MEVVNLGNMGIPVIKGDTGEQGKPGINGEDGFCPTITEKVNTDDAYILEVTDINGSFETPNLKGKNGSNIEDYGIFYWDGKSSDDNVENIALWQKIIDKAQEQTVMVFSSLERDGININRYNAIFIVNKFIISNTATLNGLLSNANSINTNNLGSYYITHCPQVNLELSDNNIISVSSLSFLDIYSKTFLPTNTQTVTSYEPTYDYHPATKKYVDDNIINSLSNISGLTPQIVDVLPSVENANSNTIYLVPDEEATEENLYNEYLFIDGRYEPIGKRNIAGADLTEYAKKEEIPLIYFWDGKNSTQNIDNISLFQEIIDKHNEGKDIIIIGIINSQTYVFIFSANNTSDNNTYQIKSNVFSYMEIQSNDSTKINYAVCYRLDVKITENIVTEITRALLPNNTIKTLDINIQNNEKYFTPTYKSQPASKGYLDDLINNGDTAKKVFSTEEKSIGKATNEKPLYEKMIEFNYIHSASSQTDNAIKNISDFGISDVDLIWIDYGNSFVLQNGVSLPLNYSINTEYMRTYVSSSSLVSNIYYSGDLSLYYVICLRYTKTTD